ncbi:MAG: hypothetical protein AAGI01_15900, partial [Myxococcota bacterium]
MDRAPTFSDVRSLMQRPPSPETWGEVLMLCALWPDPRELSETIVPYVAGHLESWPQRLRRAPWGWFERARSNPATPIHELPLAREIVADRDALSVDTAPLFRLAAAQAQDLRVIRTQDIELRGAAEHIGALEHLEHLEAWNARLEDEHGRILLSSGPFGHLRTLKLGANDIRQGTLLALQRTAPKLEHLDLSANALGDEAARELGRLPSLGRLRTLNLRFTALRRRGIEMLMRSLRGDQLGALWLGGNLIEDHAAEAIAQCPQLKHVHTLDLGHAPTLLEARILESSAIRPLARQSGEGVAAALAASPYVLGLQRLDLYHNELGPTGARALAAATMPSLEHLDVAINELGPDGARALLASPLMERLVHLDLSHNHLDATLHEPLTEHADSLEPLRELVLRGNELGDEGAELLAQLSLVRRLRLLDLYHNDIGPRGVGALVDHHALVGLEVLDLSYNDIGEDGARALDHPSLARLRRLVVGP